MKAVQFNGSIPRYLLGKTLGAVYPPVFWSGASCLYLDDIPTPPLPGPDWVRVNTRYGGICGTDIGTIQLHTSPYNSPFSSFPFTFGHENMGTIAEVGPQAAGWQPGDRVVVEPHLWCAPRGFSDLCPYCARGETNLCERITEGRLSPGIMTGFCRDTGGSWSASFLAHTSQLYKVPDSISDENAVLLEPFAVGLHAAANHMPADEMTVIIQGAGTIGLLTLAALRALGSQARILVLARYPCQADAAERLGASEVILTRGVDAYAAVAEHTGAVLRKPILGKRVISGGADMVFECVGSDSSIDDALRMTRSGGTAVLVGVPGIAKGIDWTAIFQQELTLVSSTTYHHAEPYQGKTWKAFDLGLHLMAQGLDLGWLVTHKYTLAKFNQAMQDHTRRGKHNLIKGVFAFE